MNTFRWMIIVLLLSVVFNANSQNIQTKKVWFGVDYSYGLGIQDNGKSFSLNRSNSNGNMHFVDIRAMAGYYVIPSLSLGVGLGLAGYHNPGFNTMPVFLDVRYNLPLQNQKFFVYSDIGFPVAVNSNVRSLYMTDWGFGYKLPVKKINIVPSLGYNFISYKTEWETASDRRFRHSLFLRLGIEY